MNGGTQEEGKCKWPSPFSMPPPVATLAPSLSGWLPRVGGCPPEAGAKWLANKSRCVSGPSLGHESGGREGEMMRRGRGVWQIGEEEKTLMAESGG